jgi:hypothetical protein
VKDEGANELANSAHQAKAFHELLAQFERQFWIEAGEHLFAAFRIHGREFAHEFVAHFPFCIAAPAHADGEKGGHCPDGDVSGGDHDGNEIFTRTRIPDRARDLLRLGCGRRG